MAAEESKETMRVAGTHESLVITNELPSKFSYTKTWLLFKTDVQVIGYGVGVWIFKPSQEPL